MWIVIRISRELIRIKKTYEKLSCSIKMLLYRARMYNVNRAREERAFCEICAPDFIGVHCTVVAADEKSVEDIIYFDFHNLLLFSVVVVVWWCCCFHCGCRCCPCTLTEDNKNHNHSISYIYIFFNDFFLSLQRI